jgi:tetratricopeptide (TPR) repeat protein
MWHNLCLYLAFFMITLFLPYNVLAVAADNDDTVIKQIVKSLRDTKEKGAFSRTSTHIKVSHGTDQLVANESNKQGPKDGVKKNSDKDTASSLKSKKMSLEISKDAKNVEEINTLLNDAYQAFYLGQLESATKIYRDILKSDPDNQDATFGLATIYYKDGEKDEAKKMYKSILEKDATNIKALNNLLSIVGESDPEKAINEFKKLEAIDPYQDIFPAQIAMIYKNMGKNPEAVKYMSKAVRLSSSNWTYRYNLAVILDGMGEIEGAKRVYEQLLEAGYRGVELPVSPATISDRITYLIYGATQSKEV